jgi:hypothetical protein
LLVKNTTSSGQEWGMFDNMRGLVTGTDGDAQLFANASSAENVSAYFRATATGFACEDASTRYNNSGNTYIYIAIRRGPMKVPTSGTSVFSPNLSSSSGGTITTNFPVDLSLNSARASSSHYSMDRLRGASTNFYNVLVTNTTAGEDIGTGAGLGFDNNTGFVNSWSGSSYVWWNFRRAPSFFDEVCYTGTGTPTNFSHNLAVVPELMIVKRRNASSIWAVYAAPLANAATSYLELNDSNAVGTGNTVLWNSTAPTSTVFTIGSSSNINTNGSTNVAYLFATCAGVSKVGSYTGNGTTQTIDCGFGAGGARFVLIRRTDSTGDWYVYDTARGMTVLTDPYLRLNSTAAEVATLGSVTTVSTGFAVNASILAAINTNAASYIFLAIA